MNVVFFPRTRDPQVRGYLLGFEDADGKIREAEPWLIAGNGSRFEAALATDPFAQPYLSGAFSWGEQMGDVGEPKILQTVGDGVALLLHDLPVEEFERLVVLHRRRSGFDVHFVILKRHLRSGVQAPLFCNTEEDWRMIGRWRRLANLQNGWSDPEDSWRKGVRAKPPRGMNEDKLRVFQWADGMIVEGVASGTLQTRATIIDELDQHGFQITKVTPRSLAVLNRIDGEEFELAGEKYREGADLALLRSRINSAASVTRQDVADEIRWLKPRVARLRLKRANTFRNRFGARHPAPVVEVPQLDLPPIALCENEQIYGNDVERIGTLLEAVGGAVRRLGEAACGYLGYFAAQRGGDEIAGEANRGVGATTGAGGVGPNLDGASEIELFGRTVEDFTRAIEELARAALPEAPTLGDSEPEFTSWPTRPPLREPQSPKPEHQHER